MSVFVVTALAGCAAGCGAAEARCASTSECAAPFTCQSNGACAPLVDDPALRFLRGRWLPPRDWAVTRSDVPATVIEPTDFLMLGGPARAVIHFALGPLRDDDDVALAELVLVPHESWSGPSDDARVAVQRTRAFSGAKLTARRAPVAIGSPLAMRDVARGPARPIRLDLTDAIREAVRRGDTELYVALRLVNGTDTTWRFVSPESATASARPRLELLER